MKMGKDNIKTRRNKIRRITNQKIKRITIKRRIWNNMKNKKKPR
jgi:hypothetical protein